MIAWLWARLLDRLVLSQAEIDALIYARGEGWS